MKNKRYLEKSPVYGKFIGQSGVIKANGIEMKGHAIALYDASKNCTTKLRVPLDEHCHLELFFHLEKGDVLVRWFVGDTPMEKPHLLCESPDGPLGDNICIAVEDTTFPVDKADDVLWRYSEAGDPFVLYHLPEQNEFIYYFSLLEFLGSVHPRCKADLEKIFIHMHHEMPDVLYGPVQFYLDNMVGVIGTERLEDWRGEDIDLF